MAPSLTRQAETPGLAAPQTHVLDLAKQIERLAGGGSPLPEFFSQFLKKLLESVSAPAGAVWLMENGRLRLYCEKGLATTGFQDQGVVHRFHQRLLSEVATNGQSRILHTDDEKQVSFPKPQLLIVAALRANNKCVGIVEVFQRPDVALPSRSGYMQFVEQLAGHASMYLQRRLTDQRPPSKTEVDEDLGRFGLQLQRSLRLKEVAAVSANDGRILIDCDRVSVVMQRGRQVRVVAVSGQESIHRRSNLIKSMVRLARPVIRSGTPLKYQGEMDSFPPQVKDPLADFVHEGGARLVYVLPLHQPTPVVHELPSDRTRPTKRHAFGCLIIEQFHQSEPSGELSRKLEWFANYSSSALYNARTYESLFLMPVWSALGKATDWFYGRKLLKGLAAILVATIVAYLMAFVMIEHRVEGEGRLMPVVRREIFVPYDGEVVDVLVSSGQRVTTGQTLVVLHNNELKSEIIAVESQREEKLKLLSGLLAERDELIRGPTSERNSRIEGAIARTTAELHGLERKQQVLDQRQQSLNIVSPIDGVVSTFEVDQLLRHRPVRRGEILLEVMDDSGPWQLELDVAQNRTGHLMRAQADSSEPLDIDYLLVSAPEKTYHASFKEMGTRVTTSDDKWPVVELLATTAADDQLQRRIGTEVRARIHCGRKSVGYVLFGDIVEFVQKYLWL